MTIDQSNAALMQAIGFNSEDLAANRGGKPSARQLQIWESGRQQYQQRVVSAPRSSPYIIIMYIVVFAVIAVVFVAVGGLKSIQTALGGAAIPVLAAVVLVFVVIIAVIPGQMKRSAQREQQRMASLPPVSAAPIQMIEGQIKTKSGYNDNTNSHWYEVHIGGKKFSVSKDALHAFQNGKQYRLFYTIAPSGRSAMLISGEALES